MEKMIKDGSKTLKNVIRIYSDVAKVSRPTWARILKGNKNSITVESKWSFSDLQRRKKLSLARTYIVKKDETNSITHEIPLSVTAFNPDMDLHAILKTEEEDSEEKQYLQIWKNQKLLYSLDVSKSKEHGTIHCDSFQWCGTQLLYLAEPKRDVESFFKEPVESSLFEISEKMGNEFSWQESWGEAKTKMQHPQLCYFNSTDFKVTVKKPPENVSILEAIWGPQCNTIYTGFDEQPYKLGLYACTNRKSVIYCCKDTTDSNDSPIAITAIGGHVRSPRFDPSQKYLIYLQNDCLSTHCQCSQLMMFDWEKKQNKVLVDIVSNPTESEFPGIFTEEFPERCFTSNGSHVIFSSMWHEKVKVIAVDLKTGHVIDLCKGFLNDVPESNSVTVLDVHRNKVVAVLESFNIEPCLMIGHLEFTNDQLSIRWEYLDSDSPNYLDDIEFDVKNYEPVIVNELYPGLKSQLVLIRSKTLSSMEPGHPMIITAHGGPHSTYTAVYNSSLAAFLRLGYIICLVNYRGSIGFGENSIKSLLGNIGVQDLSDVYQAIKVANEMVKEKGILRSDELFYMGGSHGGFLGAAICAKYPGEFKACALRNPVVDLASMAVETDIPDWNFVECGLKFNYHFPSEEDKALMFSKSPIRNVKSVITPTLLSLGAKDLRVPHCQGRSYYKALKSQNVQTKLCLYPNDGHSLDSVAASSDTFVQTAIWFSSFLPCGKENTESTIDS